MRRMHACLHAHHTTAVGYHSVSYCIVVVVRRRALSPPPRGLSSMSYVMSNAPAEHVETSNDLAWYVGNVRSNLPPTYLVLYMCTFAAARSSIVRSSLGEKASSHIFLYAARGGGGKGVSPRRCTSYYTSAQIDRFTCRLALGKGGRGVKKIKIKTKGEEVLAWNES